MPIALETVVKQLADSGIIAPGKLEDFVPPKATPKDGEALLRELHKQGLLTKFQAQQVAANKSRALILGGYILIDRIGAGGMGQVFKAQHRKMERIVAIKMLPPAMMKDAAAAARFEREVRAAAKLRHTNIVAADDAAEANGIHFLVMEYVDGEDLSALVKKNGPFPVGKAVNYILQAARGLEFAHSKGVIHRDIKPANLLLSSDGTVKILDMGLARIDSDGPAQSELTSTGTIMGTVDYMSPEQALNTKNADHRADIYSLGISLYYLLAGKAAYGGDTAMEKLMAHQTQPIPCLQDAQTTVSKQLDAVFRKMVAKKIEDRYQSMSEVIEALEGLGLAGSSTGGKGNLASTIDLSSADKKKLAAQAKKKPLGSITEVVASEKTKHLVLKIAGGTFATIIAPILVTYLIKHLERKDEPHNPPAASRATETLLPPGEGGRRPDEGQRPSETDLARRQDPLPSPLPKGEGARAPLPAKAPFDAAQAKAHQTAWAKHLGTKVETINSVGMRLTLIPPGEFLMGSTPEQIAIERKIAEDDKKPPSDPYFGRLAAEMPQHKVTITNPFLMGSTEVTVAQFRKFVEATKYFTEAEKPKDADKGKNWKSPGSATTDDMAVTQITWNDACAYCAWLSEQEQRRPWYRPDGRGSWLIAAYADGYRLPTEAEWEYGCRAGTTTQYSFGDDKSQLEQYGWFSKNHRSGPQPVALKLPNPFGLFDIHGNALEWCQDGWDPKWYEKSSPADPNSPSSDSRRMMRSGSFPYGASDCRSAFRSYESPSYHFVNTGFRIVRPLDPTQPETAVATTANPNAASGATATLLPPGEGGRRPDEGQRPSETDLASRHAPVPSPLPKGEGAGAPLPAKAPFGAAQAKAHQAAWAKHLGTKVETINSVGMRMTLIPPGDFLMGSTPEQAGDARKMGEDDKMPPTDTYFARLPEEMPQHKVTISQPFLMGSTEVTVAQFRKFVEASNYETEAEKYGFGNSGDKALTDKVKEADKGKNWKNPGYSATDDTAVTQITWNDACAYCAWLSEQEQRRSWYRPDGKGGWLTAAHADGYRLPTEAEWEYACRAGTPTQYLFGDDKSQLERYGWFNKNAGGKTQPVALKLPNPFGLFDIAGNAYEWCQDWYDGKWYEKSSPADPLGPSSGSLHVIRGGYWSSNASVCRSAFRNNSTPSYRYSINGFRCVRVADTAGDSQLATNTTTQPTTLVTPAITQPNQPWNTPAFQAWMKDVQAMPAEKQIEAVSKKLMELNPGFDGKVTGADEKGPPKIEEGMVTEIGFVTESVTDISPVRALVGLRFLNCSSSRVGKGKLADLSPLKGMKLTNLNCSYSPQVADLSALRGMQLESLYFGFTQVSDLSPLEGMHLKLLSCGYTKVSNLRPLEGMPLTNFSCGSTVSDLSPLKGMNLNYVWFMPQSITNGIDVLREMKNIKIIGIGAPQNQEFPPAEFWKKYDAGEFGKPAAPAKKLAYLDPAFEQWVKATQALPAEKQIEAVSKKLTELNPGFDGRVFGVTSQSAPKIDNGVVTAFGFLSDSVSDVSPVRALQGLKTLTCANETFVGRKLSDLSPLSGMQLTSFDCATAKVSDLTALRGMPLKTFACNATLVTDLSAIAGMPLTSLNVSLTAVSDLSVLRGMKLTNLFCQGTKVSDLSPLYDCTTLHRLSVSRTKVTPAEVAALQKALPNCKIEWEDPAKAATKKPAYLDPAFQQWVADTQKLPAEQQIEAVRKKLMELNPGYDGKMAGIGAKGNPYGPIFKGDGVKSLGLHTKDVTDISPVRAFVGLKGLSVVSLELSDLSPLQGMALTKLICSGTKVSDLSPLKEMPLTDLAIDHTAVTDLSPLEDCKSLTSLHIKSTKVTPAQIAALQNALPNCKIEWDGASSASPPGEDAKPKTPEPAASDKK